MPKPPHPGETIKENYLVPLKTGANRRQCQVLGGEDLSDLLWIGHGVGYWLRSRSRR